MILGCEILECEILGCDSRMWNVHILEFHILEFCGEILGCEILGCYIDPIPSGCLIKCQTPFGLSFGISFFGKSKQKTPKAESGVSQTNTKTQKEIVRRKEKPAERKENRDRKVNKRIPSANQAPCEKRASPHKPKANVKTKTEEMLRYLLSFLFSCFGESPFSTI